MGMAHVPLFIDLTALLGKVQWKLTTMIISTDSDTYITEMPL